MKRDDTAAPFESPGGLFEEFFSVPHQVEGEVHEPVWMVGKGCWWADPLAIPLGAGRGFNVQAVGESRFQAEIASIVGGRCANGHNCHVPAELVLAGMERDADAVGIRINGRPVGYLPFETAEAIRPLLVALSSGGKAVTCKAKIVGGWDRGESDRGLFGVKLSLSLPPRILRPSGRR